MTTERTERYESVDMPTALANCGNRREDQHAKVKCPVCNWTVLLHCDDCELQITGCRCTEEDRFGPEMAAERMKARGMWLPEWDN